MSATRSQSTRVKPLQAAHDHACQQSTMRSLPRWVMSYEALPGCCRRCDVRAHRRGGPVEQAQHTGSARWHQICILPVKKTERCASDIVLAGVHGRSAETDRPKWRRCAEQAAVSATQLGKHLDLSRQRIAVLADVEHVIVRLPNGPFHQQDAQFMRGRRIPPLCRRDLLLARAPASSNALGSALQLLLRRLGRGSRDWEGGHGVRLELLARARPGSRQRIGGECRLSR
jgi:hypothetical protein